MKDLNTPLWQLTVGEFLELIRNEIPKPEVKISERKHVYGIKGIAELFGCSTATAQRIKKSGRIDKAVTQVGRKIVVDCDRALELYKLKK